jgi:hypothetical protein
VPTRPSEVTRWGPVGDKFGDRSWEANALAEPDGEPRLVDPLGGDGEHRFLGLIDIGGSPEATRPVFVAKRHKLGDRLATFRVDLAVPLRLTQGAEKRRIWRGK